jgi:hypothetical protein
MVDVLGGRQPATTEVVEGAHGSAGPAAWAGRPWPPPDDAVTSVVGVHVDTGGVAHPGTVPVTGSTTVAGAVFPPSYVVADPAPPAGRLPR